MTEIVCPGCGQRTRWSAGNRWRPFCSEQCKLLDMGDWLMEKHRIPTEDAAPPPEDDGN